MEKLKRINSIYPYAFPGLTLSLLLAFMHLLFTVFGDDIGNMRLANERGLVEFVLLLYNNWSSRFIVEAGLWLALQNWWLWVFLNISLLVLLIYFFVKTLISKPDNKAYWICVLAFLAYPFWHMGTAGHLTTTTVYLWPATFGVIAGYGMKKSILGEKIHAWEYPVYLFALIYASNTEQLNLILTGTLIFLSGYNIIKNKRVNVFLLLQLAIVIAMLFIILQAPGNAVRNYTEVRNWFPNYNMLSIMERVQLGYGHTFSHFLFNPNLVYTIFCALLYIAVHLQYSDRFFRVIAFIPLLSSISLITAQVFTRIPSILHRVNLYGTETSHLVNVSNAHLINYYIPIIFSGFIMLCILASVYLCFKNETLKAWFGITILILGFASGIMMGFSPTVWASNTRQFLFVYLVLIACIVLIYQKIRLQGFKHESVLFVILVFFAIVSYTGYIASLIITR